MGKNRKWVLENNLSEAVWDHFKGSTPAGHTIAQFSDAPSSTKPPAKSSPVPLMLGKGKGQPKGDGRGSSSKRWSEGGRRRTQSASFPQPGRAVDGSPSPSRQVGGSTVGRRRRGSSDSGIEGGVHESSNPSAGPTSARSGGTDESISGSVTEEAGVKPLKPRKSGWTSRRGMSIECLAIRSQGAIKCFHCHQRSTRGDSSIAIEDCTDGSISGRRLHPGGDPDEETQDVGRFFHRFGASGRRRPRAGALMSNLTKPTCR